MIRQESWLPCAASVEKLLRNLLFWPGLVPDADSALATMCRAVAHGLHASAYPDVVLSCLVASSAGARGGSVLSCPGCSSAWRGILSALHQCPCRAQARLWLLQLARYSGNGYLERLCRDNELFCHALQSSLNLLRTGCRQAYRHLLYAGITVAFQVIQRDLENFCCWSQADD